MTQLTYMLQLMLQKSMIKHKHYWPVTILEKFGHGNYFVNNLQNIYKNILYKIYYIYILQNILFSFQEIRSYEYRSAIHKAVPNVKILDDEPFLVEKVGGKPVLREPPPSHRPHKVPEHLKADWQLVNEGIKAIDIDEPEESSCMFSLLLFLFAFNTGVCTLLWPAV